jgi:hypothetical protein
MRIGEIISQRRRNTKNFEQANVELLDSIEIECQQYLSAVKTAGKWLLRGQSPGRDAYMATTSLRSPKTSDPILSNLFDQALMQLGFMALRKTSIFATSDFHHAKAYGAVYIVFPIDGESQFTYTNQQDLELNHASQIPLKDSGHSQEIAAALIAWIREWVKKYPDAQKQLNSMYPPFSSLKPDWSLEEIMEKVEEFCYYMERPMPRIPSHLTNWDAGDDDDEDDLEPEDLEASDIDLDAFVQMYNPRQDHLETALASGVEVYITGRYYALKQSVWADAVVQKWGVPVQG